LFSLEIFNKSKPQAEILQDIEDILIQADVGISFVEEFRKNIANKKYSKEELTKENFNDQGLTTKFQNKEKNNISSSST